MTGLLQVTGSIDTGQFWPVGLSAADKTKILVTVEVDAIGFRKSPNWKFKVTRVFDNATVIGWGARRPAIDKGRITFRLQGIDATDLHYRPAAAKKFPKNPVGEEKEQHDKYLEWNLEYRQFFAETTTVALHDMLSEAEENPVPCRIVTAVHKPDDVFDVYGRMVADVLITIGDEEININQWLVANGYALPTFYNSMSREEIAVLTAAAGSARKNRLGLWDDLYSASIISFDWECTFRRKALVNPAADAGPAFLPKLFRRPATFKVNARAAIISGSFARYLASKKDELFLLADFLNGNAHAITLDNLVVENGLSVAPEKIVFREDVSSHLTKLGNAPVAW